MRSGGRFPKPPGVEALGYAVLITLTIKSASPARRDFDGQMVAATTLD
jgi:hypothetical protein